MAIPGIVLSQIWVYPLKSAAGVACSSARTALRGLEHDRRWMVVDAAGMLVTQRERPELSQVTPSLVGDALHVEAEGMPVLTLPLRPVGGQLTVKMWTEPVTAACIEAATDWFSTFLGGAYRLVYMPDSTLRPSPDHAPSPVSFVDGNPFLVVSEASVADLNRRLDKPVSSLHFRPNLVLRGCEAFAEDTWDSVEIGSGDGVMRLKRVGPCVRCVLVNVDPTSGTVHKEPLRTLARYRRVGNAVHFGQNFRYGAPPVPGTVLSCGDPVTLKGSYGAA